MCFPTNETGLKASNNSFQVETISANKQYPLMKKPTVLKLLLGIVLTGMRWISVGKELS